MQEMHEMQEMQEMYECRRCRRCIIPDKQLATNASPCVMFTCPPPPRILLKFPPTYLSAVLLGGHKALICSAFMGGPYVQSIPTNSDSM